MDIVKERQRIHDNLNLEAYYRALTLFDPAPPPWEITYAGGSYSIYYDPNRKYLQPKWRIERLNDSRFSKRWYSYPEGAFTALRSETIIWL